MAVAAVSGAAQVGIRQAGAADIPALTALSAELGYPSTEEQMARRWARIEADPDHCVLVAVEQGGGVIGWVQVHLTKILESDPRGEVVGLVVAPGARRRGAGRELMRAAERWTAEHGGAMVSLRSNVTRQATHRFYEQLGYAVTKTQSNFRKTLTGP
jgi:ribosomal protein S18 acetylase RimI-like enzyme